MKPRYEIIPEEPYKGVTTCRVCIGKGEYQSIEFARTKDDVLSWLMEQSVVPLPEVYDEDNGTEGVKL